MSTVRSNEKVFEGFMVFLSTGDPILITRWHPDTLLDQNYRAIMKMSAIYPIVTERQNDHSNNIKRSSLPTFRNSTDVPGEFRLANARVRCNKLI